nr:hypothetical protein [Candidatus Sigynarchaeota archaeon]
MPDSKLIRIHDFSDTVKQISWNGDEKQPLISFLVDGKQEIFVFNTDGELKQTLAGHQAAVQCHDWIAPDTIASISVDGEMRLWTMRGSRFDCTKIKEPILKPGGIAGTKPVKRPALRFLAWYSDTICEIFENGKPTAVKKSFPGKIFGAAGIDDQFIIAYEADDGCMVEVCGPGFIFKRSRKITFPARVTQVDIIKNTDAITGIIILGDTGKIEASPLDDKKGHQLGSVGEITAFCTDKESRTLFAGNKSGNVSTHAFRLDFSFGDKIASIEAHEFKITVLAFIKKSGLLVAGGLDGVAKFHKISDGFLQKAKAPAENQELDWKEKERAGTKLSIAEEAVEKGDMARAKELVELARKSKVPGLESRIDAIEARMKLKSESKNESESIKSRLLDYLDKIAEDRGEILLDEISKALAISHDDLKRLIKDLDEEMEWEYSEQYECLFLFDRTVSIARETDIERQIARGLDETHRFRRDETPRFRPRRQFGQVNRFEHQRPRQQPRPAGVREERNDVAALGQFFNRVKGQMKAAIIDPELKVIDLVGLPDLSTQLEHLSRPAKFIITDGIISPRIASQAEKIGIKVIIGQRIHPNLDRATLKVNCLEFDEIGRAVTTPGEPQPDSLASSQEKKGPAPGLETTLLQVLREDKWKNIDDILSEARITDGFEKDLARVKLKQLAGLGSVETESYKNVQYFKLSRKK